MEETNARSLTVVIPALNEEEAIGDTISRCLQARQQIREEAGLAEMEIIVVSDGSTDRTAEIAQGFSEVRTIVFEQNRGYGAAIKEGFRQGRGDLVGFLDADGTCDPVYFKYMCKAALDQSADVVLGSRMGPQSKMPHIRRLGNHLYALLLGVLCGRVVTDTASGMRVIRRRSLDELYPLPDGLHFTPAMSARAILNNLRVIEIPMRYEERVGDSKLRPLRDGIRFLRVIIEGVLCYRPERIFLMTFVLFSLLAALLAAYPVEFYAQNRRVEEWMIYRFIACFLLGGASFVLLSAAAFTNRLVVLGPRRREGESFWASLASKLFEGLPLWTMTGGAVLTAAVLLAPAAVEYVTTGHVTTHWSRIMVGAFGLLLAFHAGVTAVMLRVIEIWKRQLDNATNADERLAWPTSEKVELQ